MKKIEYILGFIGILLILVLGNTLLKTDVLFLRLLLGTGLGYALARAYTGFAGSINRAYRTGSTQLMRTMMFMFFITALLMTAFLFKSDPGSYHLWIKPINMGLLLGGFLFGFGMSISICCASGVLTDLPQGFPRAFITLIFFGLGVFLGYPVQNTASWVRNSWFITPTGVRLNEGVFLPDLFKWDGFEGYLGALLLIALFGAVIAIISYYYEKKLKQSDCFIGHGMEQQQAAREQLDVDNFKIFSAQTYRYLFVRPWTLKEGAIIIAIIFTIMTGITRAGWGVSFPYGVWFGKVLMLFGISAEALGNFTHMAAENFTEPFFQQHISVQNFGIIAGAVIYLLTAGKFFDGITAEWDLSRRDVILYALGGILMGFGTRLANGCNVGALYTPIANFSLSGWIFLVVMVIGGIVSNRLLFDCPLYSRESQQ